MAVFDDCAIIIGTNSSDSFEIALRMKLSLLIVVLTIASVSLHAADGPMSETASHPTPQQAEFFNSKVRPLLESRCWRCHAADKQEGGLRLDSLAATLRGGDSGATVVPGLVGDSLLIEAVRYESFEMPPDAKMPEGEVAILERWIEMGAPWPAGGNDPSEDTMATDARAEIRKAAKSHWAFQPLTRPRVPVDEHDDWSKNEIDSFVWRKMKQNDIEPSPPADRRTLVRRAFLDLIGMPPTPKEMEKSSAPEFAAIVDDLLGDARYGERWARHWLDVARYADSKGAVFGQPRRYPYAYTYRDYVIASLNDDKPFDDFIREQLAADLLTDKSDDPSLAALAFLTIHKRSDAGGIEEQRADRVDTIGRALLGLTVACARCHDHKYDPLTMIDFYSLYGICASIEEPDDLPVIGGPESGSTLEKSFLEFKAEEDRKLQEFRDENYARLMKQNRGDIGKYLLMAHEGRELPEGEFRTLAGRQKLNPHIALRWKKRLVEHGDDAVFGPWHAFAALPTAEFEQRAEKLADQVMANKLVDCQLNPFVAAAFDKQRPESLSDVAAIYQKLFDEIDKEWLKHASSFPNTLGLENLHQEQLRKLLYGEDAPGVIPADDFKTLDRSVFLQLINTLIPNRDLRLAMHPGSPRRAMIVRDTEKLYDPHIFIRGNKDRPGEAVPRQFIGLLAGEDQIPFTEGSGRLELAEAIVAPDNPLTARVIVNRVWAWHFGRGLVDTPSDFGLRSSPPSHPELLDWLTSEFVDSGWSIKQLHRLILNSATYQQSSHSDKEKLTADPENRLLWRFNRRRLEYEAIHDSMLAVSGKLDPTRGGPSSLMFKYAAFDQKPNTVTWEFNPYRRAIYGAIERDKLPSLLLTFDFPNPDETNSGRNTTTVPTQSLFLMNGDFTMEMATALVARDEIQIASDPHERIRRLYDRVFNRTPTTTELRVASAFIQSSRPDEEDVLPRSEWVFGFAPYDRDKVVHDIAAVKTFPHFVPTALQGDIEFPDTKNGLGWLRMTPSGGHAGGGGVCLVRQWKSPVSGVVDLEGTLKHGATQGDGVRATVYVRGTKAGQWSVHNEEAATTVAGITVSKGDQIAFVIDYVRNGTYDGFQWAPEVRESPKTGDEAQTGTVWSSKQGFPKMPDAQVDPLDEFDAWERLAQVLLMSNEFMFLE